LISFQILLALRVAILAITEKLLPKAMVRI